MNNPGQSQRKLSMMEMHPVLRNKLSDSHWFTVDMDEKGPNYKRVLALSAWMSGVWVFIATVERQGAIFPFLLFVIVSISIAIPLSLLSLVNTLITRLIFEVISVRRLLPAFIEDMRNEDIERLYVQAFMGLKWGCPSVSPGIKRRILNDLNHLFDMYLDTQKTRRAFDAKISILTSSPGSPSILSSESDAAKIESIRQRTIEDVARIRSVMNDILEYTRRVGDKPEIPLGTELPTFLDDLSLSRVRTTQNAAHELLSLFVARNNPL